MKKNDLYNDILCKIRETLPSRSAFLVTAPSDLIYLLGFYSEGAVLFVPEKGAPSLLIDGMNRSLAEDSLKEKEIVFLPGLFRAPEGLTGAALRFGAKKIFIDPGAVSLRSYRKISRALRGFTLSAGERGYTLRNVIDGIRETKSSHEISLLRHAARETSAIWEHVRKKIRPGMTELEIASLVDGTIADAGYKNSFPTIAACGKNSAYPHAVPGNKRLGRTEHIVLDFGICHKFYCSDLTRVWGECRISGQLREVFDRVRDVQKSIIDLVGPGESISGVAKKAKEMLAEGGMERYVLHGPGHGIGIDVHENPPFNIRSKRVFRENMVLTVEPGLYIPGKGGVRIEDMVIVTPEGREVLTK